MNEDVKDMLDYFRRREQECRERRSCKRCGRGYFIATKLGETDPGYCDLCKTTDGPWPQDKRSTWPG